MGRKLASHEDAVRHATHRDGRLTAMEFNKTITVEGRLDGLRLVFPDAIAEEWQGWLIVYTEHYGPHLFRYDSEEIRWSSESTQSWRQSRQVTP